MFCLRSLKLLGAGGDVQQPGSVLDSIQRCCTKNPYIWFSTGGRLYDALIRFLNVNSDLSMYTLY